MDRIVLLSRAGGRCRGSADVVAGVHDKEVVAMRNSVDGCMVGVLVPVRVLIAFRARIVIGSEDSS